MQYFAEALGSREHPCAAAPHAAFCIRAPHASFRSIYTSECRGDEEAVM